MIVAEIIVLVLILLAAWLSIRKVERTFTERLAEQDRAEEGRRLALYKQQKASERTVVKSDSAVRKLADQVRGLHDDTRQMQASIDEKVKEVRRHS